VVFIKLRPEDPRLAENHDVAELSLLEAVANIVLLSCGAGVRLEVARADQGQHMNAIRRDGPDDMGLDLGSLLVVGEHLLELISAERGRLLLARLSR
jgi:hypothetical protein